MPEVFLIGGPNGAGKTTAACQLLGRELAGLEFVNADLLAERINPAAPETVAFQAGRLMLERLEALLQSASDSFVFESTLATRSFVPFLTRCRERGYRINLLYFWLTSPDLALRRVAERVRAGGHNVPGEDIRRRYNRSIANLINLYLPLADRWVVYDNSSDSPRRIAEYRSGGPVLVDDGTTWNSIKGECNA